jgi:hypothetical protein
MYSGTGPMDLFTSYTRTDRNILGPDGHEEFTNAWLASPHREYGWPLSLFSPPSYAVQPFPAAMTLRPYARNSPPTSQHAGQSASE